MSKAADAIAKAENKMQMKKEGRVGYVIYNNPERHNAVSLDMWEAAVAILDEYRNDKDISVVVVTGAGGKAFVSGADISKFEKERSDEASVARYGQTVEASYNAFHTFPKPTIAMIRGYCIGGGWHLVADSDIIIAAEHATFALPEINSGTVADAASIKLPRRIPYAVAMEMLFTGRRVDAAEAKHWGLINEVVAADQLMARAEAIARFALAISAPLRRTHFSALSVSQIGLKTQLLS